MLFNLPHFFHDLHQVTTHVDPACVNEIQCSSGNFTSISVSTQFAASKWGFCEVSIYVLLDKTSEHEENYHDMWSHEAWRSPKKNGKILVVEMHSWSPLWWVKWCEMHIVNASGGASIGCQKVKPQKPGWSYHFCYIGFFTNRIYPTSQIRIDFLAKTFCNEGIKSAPGVSMSSYKPHTSQQTHLTSSFLALELWFKLMDPKIDGLQSLWYTSQIINRNPLKTTILEHLILMILWNAIALKIKPKSSCYN